VSKYKLELRHRAQPDEPFDIKHERFISEVKSLGTPWDLERLESLPNIGSELLVVSTLDKAFDQIIKGRLTYVLRSDNYLEDEAQYDDTIFAEFDPKKVDFADIVMRVLPKYIDAFECYRATCSQLVNNTQ